MAVLVNIATLAGLPGDPPYRLSQSTTAAWLGATNTLVNTTTWDSRNDDGETDGARRYVIEIEADRLYLVLEYAGGGQWDLNLETQGAVPGPEAPGVPEGR